MLRIMNVLASVLTSEKCLLETHMSLSIWRKAVSSQQCKALPEQNGKCQ